MGKNGESSYKSVVDLQLERKKRPSCKSVVGLELVQEKNQDNYDQCACNWAGGWGQVDHSCESMVDL